MVASVSRQRRGLRKQKSDEVPPATHSLCICRINEANVHDVWKTANLSADELLLRACVPTLVSHYIGNPIGHRLLEASEIGGLKCLLSDERSQWLSAISRVSAVAAWVKAAPTGESQQRRINGFAELVALIQFDNISPQDCIGLLCDDDFAALPSSCKCVPRSTLLYCDYFFTS